LENNDLRKLHERIQSMALNDFSRGSKIPEDDFNMFKQQLQCDIQQYYLLIHEKNDETKVGIKNDLISCTKLTNKYCQYIPYYMYVWLHNFV